MEVCSPRGKAVERETEHSPLFPAGVKNSWSCTSVLPYDSITCTRTPSPSYFLFKSLTHWGRLTQICVFTLQLCKTEDGWRRFAFLHYNCARRMTQICIFNTRLFSLHNTLNYAIHTACLRMVLLTDVYRNLISLWINLYAPRFPYIGTGVSLLSRECFLYI